MEQNDKRDPVAGFREMAEITALWRGLSSLRRRSAGERRRLFVALGIGGKDIASIEDLLDRFKDIRVPEPGLVAIDPGCGDGWQPSVLAPVFHGFADFGADRGLPCRVRVFYPTRDGSPHGATMLTGCGRYPLVVFLHGQCGEADHYRKWDLVPAQLARSGFVVAAPELESLPPFAGDANPEVAKVESVTAWMRSSWPHAAALLPRPMTAMVGHSWGALLAAVVARRLQASGSVSAYASLSGGWLEWPSSPPRPLASLNMATLFMWGTGSSDLYSNIDGGGGAIWNEPPGASHKVVFEGGEHWDYFREGSTTCGLFRGSCLLMRSLAADFVATFLSHYLPPERWTLLGATIPHSLVPMPLELTPQQELYAGGHLNGFAALSGTGNCRITHTWRLSPFGGGSISLR